MMSSLRQVDHNALRTNQAFIITLTLIAFIVDLPVLVGFVGLVMLLGVIVRRPGFLLAYRGLQRLNMIGSDLIPDHPEPHRFAQLVGGIFLAGSTLSLGLSAPVLGWVLAWIVIALASLNLFGGFCVGCAVYYWLSRVGIPGFDKQPPAGTVPGRRPSAASQEQGHA